MSDKREQIRVLRIINRFNLGGPTFNVAYLTRYLGPEFQSRLVGGMKDEDEASSEFILENLGISPEYITEMRRSISPGPDYKAYRELSDIIREFRPHIVHTHASKAGTLGRIAAYMNGVPVILHTFHGHVFHSYFGAFKSALYRFIERRLARLSTRIIAISNTQHYELASLHRIAPEQKIEVVPLGFDLSRFQSKQEEKRQAFRSRYGLDEDVVAIGIVGRLVPIKNHEMFLHSIMPITRQYPFARFFIIGDGERSEALHKQCLELGIGFVDQAPPTAEKTLCFTSWIREIDVVMAGLDIVALTSKNEGTPVSLIEAQCAGKPVVSTRVGGITDIVLEDGSALLCDVGDQALFNRHLALLVGDPVRRAAMGKIGHAHVVQRFSRERLVRDMELLYKKLLLEKGIRSGI